MGYTTDFEGTFVLNKQLSSEMQAYLVKFNETRRMGRNVNELFRLFKGAHGMPGKIGASACYGIEGEYFVGAEGSFGQSRDSSILDYNTPSTAQPGLWCGWRPTDDGKGIEWDGGEKFYNYVEWIEYLVENMLAPNGYVLNGAVTWRGEDHSDIGTILIQDNEVKVIEGKHVEMPKRKGAKPKENPEFLIKSRRIDGATYFRADGLLNALKRVDSEDDPRLTRALIKMLNDIADRK